MDITIEVDTTDPTHTLKFAAAQGLQGRLITLDGPGGGNPLVLVSGPKEGLRGFLEAQGYDLDAYPELE